MSSGSRYDTVGAGGGYGYNNGAYDNNPNSYNPNSYAGRSAAAAGRSPPTTTSTRKHLLKLVILGDSG
jgi:hypothetical protein